VNPRNLPAAESERVLGKSIEHEYNLFELLRRPDVNYANLMSMDGGKYASADVSRETLGELSVPVVEQVEIAAKYSGYIDRQKGEVERAAHFEKLRLPPDLDYMQVTALSIEARQVLSRHRPETLGARGVWAGGALGATQPVMGAVIESEAAGSARCEQELGAGWRMAGLHAGGSGAWALQGQRGPGLTGHTRYWVHAADQKGNCWDSGG
jgi:hypothetical protein